VNLKICLSWVRRAQVDYWVSCVLRKGEDADRRFTWVATLSIAKSCCKSCAQDEASQKSADPDNEISRNITDHLTGRLSCVVFLEVTEKSIPKTHRFAINWKGCEAIIKDRILNEKRQPFLDAWLHLAQFHHERFRSPETSSLKTLGTKKLI